MPATFDFIEDAAPAATQFDFQPDPDEGPSVRERISEGFKTLPEPIKRISGAGGFQQPAIEVAPFWTTPPWVPAAKLLGFPKVAEAGQAMAEETANAISGMTTPLNVGLVAATKAYPPLGVAIAASMVPQIYEGGKQAYKGMTTGDIPEVVRGGTKAAIGTAGAVLGTLPLAARFLPRATAEAAATVPEVPESITIPEAYTGPTPPKIAAVEQAARRAEVKAARPVVPETPPEPQRGMTILDEIRAAGADTKAKIQKLFPQLSRETAAKLRDQAFPREKQPDNISRAEVDRLFLDKLNEESNREIEAATAPKPAPVTPEPAPAPETPLAISAPEAKAPVQRGRLPKVKEGYVRLWRGEREGQHGVWFSDSRETAEIHFENNRTEGPTTLSYVDVPDEAAFNYAEAAFEHPDVKSGKTIAEGGDHVLPPELASEAKVVKVGKHQPLPKAPEPTPPAKVEAPSAKEPWQMTQKEWELGRIERSGIRGSGSPHTQSIAQVKPKRAADGGDRVMLPDGTIWEYRGISGYAADNANRINGWENITTDILDRYGHKTAVEKAVKEGKSVPPEVLADYPDLAPKPAAKPAAETGKEMGAPESGRIVYRAPATGKKSRWVKVGGDWFKADSSWKPTTKKPLEPMGLRDALEEQLAREPKPHETPPTGPGVTTQPATPESRLSQSLQSVPKQKSPPQGPAAQPMGITPFPGLVTGLQKVAQSAQRVWHEIADVPKFAPFKRVINKFNADTQRTSLKIRQMQADIESRVPDPKRLEAITNWLQADGDVANLRAWEAASRNANRRQGYRDAQHLTPYEIQVAQAIRQYYDDLLARGQAYGILDQAKDDYVTQIWKRPLLGGAQFSQFASKLSRTFKFGMKSVFENFFEGEQAGYKPVTKNISKLLGVYVSELEKTIATRDMIRDLTHETASDGNPLAKVEGTAHIAQDKAGDPTGPMFVRPGVAKGDVRYAELNHPALKNWKWISKDPESGRDVFILGELRVHPEIRRHLANVLSQSQIRKWMREPSESELANIVKLAARFGDTTSKVVKQTMLGTLSTFHHVQEGTHGLGHRANAFLPPKLPVGTPELNYALDHGLQLAGEGAALENFREGLGSHGVFDKVPVLGKWIEKHNDLLFNEYIPRLKWDTWQRINRRNMERYQKEISSGEVTADDVAYLSSKQTNAAFGHQNYADLGRNATVQHGLRLLALAPDFFEARTRFAGQAAQGLLSKVGREQLEALSLLGGVFFIGARVLNKLSDDEWHFDEPFRVKYGNRWYGMRSVPEDIWRAFNDTRMFFYNRLSPVIGRPLVELASRVNYRGEKITPGEVFKNALVSGIPIQMREAPAFKSLTETQRNTTITGWEQFLSSVGIQVSRYSPLNQTYKLATKWRKAQGEKEAPTTYPVSKYQPLRYALEDHDLTRAADELTKLTEGGKVPLTKIAQGFQVSLHRPFSGSLANEGKFVASLTPDQKKLYKEAIAQRSRVWREFTNAEQEYHNRLKEGR